VAYYTACNIWKVQGQPTFENTEMPATDLDSRVEEENTEMSGTDLGSRDVGEFLKIPRCRRLVSGSKNKPSCCSMEFRFCNTYQGLWWKTSQ
jgi:hypothetical protein